jgi:hypothetical protein
MNHKKSERFCLLLHRHLKPLLNGTCSSFVSPLPSLAALLAQRSEKHFSPNFAFASESDSDFDPPKAGIIKKFSNEKNWIWHRRLSFFYLQSDSALKVEERKVSFESRITF